MTLSEELAWRGFTAETTISDLTTLDQGSRKFYWGTDPSADSLHVGHLAALMMCATFTRHGYTPYLLVGSATGQIGDPKDNGERDLKPLDEIARNRVAISQQVAAVLQIEVTDVLDNYDWFRDINYIDFLRTIGKHFSMTQLLDRKFVQDRIGEGGSGISYAEFSYSLIQGYDFLHLYREHGIDLQLCGADQFGNCVSGVHLIKRLEGADSDCYACPLIVDPSTGRKFGKSEGNAVWLDAAKTSPYDFYQFWLNQSDAAVEGYIKIYTTIPPDAVADLMTRHTADPSQRLAQKLLAYEVTKLIHSTAVADSVVKITTVLFGDNHIDQLSATDLDLLAAFTPTAALGTTLIDALVQTNLAASKSEARQLLASNAISVNGAKVSEDAKLDAVSLVKKGKNKFLLVR
jgi:tyrosyl-tRNA synthetase